jgi:SNF2 family DNA or RNA helicase
MMMKKLIDIGADADADAGLDTDAFECSSKLTAAVDAILSRKDNGNGKLIFCHFREEIDEIARRLKAGGMAKVATFDGRNKQRGSAGMGIFQEKYDALILQIQTGCEGLNLQDNYNEIYFISPHWNPAIEDQAIARCYRIGQTKTVYVRRFEMAPFDLYEEGQEGQEGQECLDPVNVEKYIGSVQQQKRELVSKIML